MKIKVTSTSPEGISVVNGSENKLEFLEILETTRTNIADGVKDRNLILNLSDICISQVDIDAEHAIDFYIQIDKPVIEMVFFISSGSVYHLDKFESLFSIEKNQHNIFNYSKNGYRNTWTVAENQKAVIITLLPENIIKYLSGKHYNKFLQNFNKETNSFLFEKNLMITPRMHQLLKDIFDKKYSDSIRRLHIENIVYELFFLQIEQYSNLVSKSENPTPLRIKNKIIEVKEFIDNNLTESHSIMSLSRLVGINDFHLKKGFKHLYNQTIYSYIIQKRMEQSRYLLINEDANVNEVAFMMGYKDATNFTAAFKKYFGYTPGTIKNK
ncbi:MAG: AraC family transcriptional regulator [Flavobacteriaceae bacterium]|jgi:AraC-like DNA-binding protein|uniref:helix-turn-helix transcriptional regulator n=1 Tax=Elizabethkingia ursingii TaxID=1756150 RepID=UPI00201257D3|nr:AraC family transcriptional regulator [Elizabethkingia ursingii]MCL1670861.1 AraC family transcriptional regulator [Elizabethkingia ursingii]MDR2228819.1 AraC family transcriptional regulator [Flavobacteriaceae bacterium]